MLIRIRGPADQVVNEIVMGCWEELEAAARAADPCMTEEACVELHRKLYAEAGADIYVRMRPERDRLGVDKIGPLRKGEHPYE
jgi:hypothetical protein